MESHMAERTFAEVFPPGEFIKEELDARGWTQADLAQILGRSPVQVNLIIQGKQTVTPETAKQLAEAFGTSAQFWLNLEGAYRLSLTKPDENPVARRANLFELFPVREMIGRGWIEQSGNIEVLEKRFCDFFEIPSLNEVPQLAHAARKSTVGDVTASQLAWLFRAKQLSHAVLVEKFSDESLGRCLERLKLLRVNREDIRQVPQVLAEAGIRLVIVELLPNTRIDGVCFWLDKESPVIALSLRYDRIDWFWHTVMHELGHIKKRDGLKAPVIDTDLVGEQAQASKDKPESERKADDFACNFLVEKTELKKFIARVRPLYSKTKIVLFANRIKVHPGIVVGQLQHLKEISYAHNREMLSKVRNVIIPSVLTDGWGNIPPV